MSHINDGLLHAYIDGACDAAETETIEDHVAECDDCAQLLDSFRAAAAEASALLGELEPGPLHAPAFEELEARSAERVAGSEDEAAAGGGQVVSSPFWRRPALAWAATVVTAFALGWQSRSEVGLPAELRSEFDQAPAQQLDVEIAQTEPDPPADQPAVLTLDEIAGLDDTREAGAGVAAAAPPQLERRAAQDSIAAGAPETAAEPETAAGLARRKAAEAAGLVGADAQTPRQRTNEPANEGQPRAAALRSQSEAESVEENAALEQGFYFAATGYVAVQPVEAELWLGMPLRELPNVVRLRTEVAPGALFADSAVGLPVIRMVYQDATGKEIVLTQQYLGDAAVLPDEVLAVRREVAVGGRLDNRARDVAAGPPPSADRDELIASGFLETLPVTIVETSGRRIYRWFDGRGYLLSVSGMIDEDVLRNLAGLVR